jgi:hypothetical protein
MLIAPLPAAWPDASSGQDVMVRGPLLPALPVGRSVYSGHSASP